MTKKTTKTNSKALIGKLDDLLNQVLQDKVNAEQAIEDSDQKLRNYMFKFVKDMATKYGDVIQKYLVLTGKYDYSDCIQHISLSSGAGAYLFLKVHVDERDALATIYWHRYQKCKLMEVHYNRNTKSLAFWEDKGNEVFREKLAYTVNFIKSGQYEKNLGANIVKECKEIIQKNDATRNIAAANNQI